MKNVLKIILFTVLVTLFYAYLGQMVPQKEVHPPKDRVIKADMTTDEMVEAGAEIVGGKGTCLGCHTIGSDKPGRFPDLGGIGSRAGSRRPGMSEVEYLAQSLYDPNVYIVEGYTPGMPPVSKPPINLSDGEIICVIAYLQSLGGTPSVTMHTKVSFAKQAPADAPPELSATAVGGSAAAGPRAPRAAKELLTDYGCLACHNLDKPDKLVGPSFLDVGKRLTPAEISQSILDPDAVTAKGFPKGIMVTTLKATAFFDKVSATEINIMVEFLASQRGKR